MQPHQLKYASGAEAARFARWHAGEMVPAEEFLLSADPNLALAEHAALIDLKVQASDWGDGQMLRTFQEVRLRHFRHYAAVGSLGESLRDGRFNCVGSTALMVLLFSETGVPVRIVETDRHVYLLARHHGKWSRVETTSRDRAVFRHRARRKWNATEIDIYQLAGLQYYNAGLQALDAGDVRQRIRYWAGLDAVSQPPDEEMLVHTAQLEKKRGLALVQEYAPRDALPHLDRAASILEEDVLIQNAITAVVLQIAESGPHHAQALAEIQRHIQQYPFLRASSEVQQVYSDLLLAVAWQNLQANRVPDALRRLAELECDLAGHPEWVQGEMAGMVYGAAWTALVRRGHHDAAEALLQRGFVFAPASRNLARKRAAMLALEN